MGVLGSFIKQSWPPKSHFTVDDIPDLSGKVYIVTGSSGGVGKETARALLKHNAKVYFAARNREKADAAIAELKQETGNEGVFLELDLMNLASVKKTAEEFQSKETRLDCLFNNAGVMFPPIEDLTHDGYDLQFGVNVLGHFYLTQLLLPVLLATAKLNPDGKARVVNTSSIGHELFDGIHFDTLLYSAEGQSKEIVEKARKRLGTSQLYNQSKVGNVIHARELAKRYGDQGLVATSCNPGNLWTDLQRNVTGVGRIFLRWLCHPAPFGALTQVWAGTSPETKDLNGKYLIPWARVGEAAKCATNDGANQKLWDWLEAQVKRFEDSRVPADAPAL